MKSMDTRNRIIKCMQEVGIMDSKKNIIDKSSISFIALFVELENEFKVQIPEHFLTIDTLNSLDFLVKLINSLKEKSE